MAEVKVSALTALTGANVANGDELYIVDTGSPNVSKKITADELAQMPQLSSRYAPLASDRVWISAPEMIAVDGSPTLTNLGGYYFPSWRLDPDAVERIAFSCFIPKGWTTYSASVWMVNANASVSGDAALAAFWVSLGVGEDYQISGHVGSAAVSFAANRNTVAWDLGTLAASLVNNDEMFRFVITRDATNGADTLAADIGVYGVLLTRVS